MYTIVMYFNFATFGIVDLLLNCQFLHLICFSYPTKQQVLEISQLIIKNYPFLKDKSVGTGYVSIFSPLCELESTGCMLLINFSMLLGYPSGLPLTVISSTAYPPLKLIKFPPPPPRATKLLFKERFCDTT